MKWQVTFDVKFASVMFKSLNSPVDLIGCSPAFTEAAQVLDMIQRTPQERSQYEQRLKAQRDDRAKLQQARTEGKAEGRAEGKAEGEAAGIIKVLRDVLGIDATPLVGLSLEQLNAMASDLRRQVRERDV